ncbi:IS21 family transposase [Nitratiruptor tergarcus]|nr:IS21 family transposase [Nitratiruptor tergarcus]
MITYEEFVMVHTLYRQGYSIRAIARMTGLDRRTVSKRLKEDKLLPRKPRVYKSKLDPYKEYIKKRIAQGLPDKIPSTVIYREITAKGYEGKIRILQAFMSGLYKEHMNVKEEEVVRFETDPGEQAQADWTVIRRGKNPVYAFAMILGYSRYAFICFTDNMRFDSFINCHKKAFAFFGGVPRTILYDNLKSVVIEHNAYGNAKHRFNERFLDFSKEYGFIPKLCKPYRAKTKGKVERVIGYMKGNFYIPLKARLKNSSLVIDTKLLNSQIFQWLEIVHNRVHATTKQKPKELFIKEQKALLPLIISAKPKSLHNKNEYDNCIDKKLSLSNKKYKNSINIHNTAKSSLEEYDALLGVCHA